MFFVSVPPVFIHRTAFNLDWGLECVWEVGKKKRLTVSRLPILINLKSNTMKNTLQRYIGFYKLQEVDALFLHNLASFNRIKACFCTLYLLLVEKSYPSAPHTCSHSTRWPVGSLSRRLQNTLCENRARLLYYCYFLKNLYSI